MGHFSMEKSLNPGSVLGGNQQSMGQREAIAFGEGVATTMRLKFEKLAGHMLPGAAKKHASGGDHGEVGDIDLASIVERLRNVPKAPASSTLGEPVSPLRQAGEKEFRRPSPFQSGNEGDKPQRAGMVGFKPFYD